MSISLICREDIMWHLEDKEKDLRMHSRHKEADGVKLAIEELKKSYVEVVHCEDCYRWNKNTHNCEVWNVTRVTDDFCSEGIYGETRLEALRDILKKMGDNTK